MESGDIDGDIEWNVKPASTLYANRASTEES